MTRRAILSTIASTLAIGTTIGLMAQSGQAPSPEVGAKKGMLSTLDPSEIDTMYLQTKLGSFRLINGAGRVEIKFTGTVLISQLNGVRTVSGNVQKEFPRNAEEAKSGRELWFGTGTIVVDGGFRAIQWFGRDMSTTWQGHGLARLYGEFDNDLNTGSYHFATEPTVQYWSPYGTSVNLPPPHAAGSQKPTITKSGG
ncbi:MAG: hypothetical protein KF784_14285 [Fimbriimonadaceae bacterium]|nr:hypothetical protein [Fimbriimonadaceae bacterium]